MQKQHQIMNIDDGITGIIKLINWWFSYFFSNIAAILWKYCAISDADFLDIYKDAWSSCLIKLNWLSVCLEFQMG